MKFFPKTRDNWHGTKQTFSFDKTDVRFTCDVFLGLVIFFPWHKSKTVFPFLKWTYFLIKINIKFYRMKERKRINGWDGLNGQTINKKGNWPVTKWNDATKKQTRLMCSVPNGTGKIHANRTLHWSHVQRTSQTRRHFDLVTFHSREYSSP